MLLWVISLPFFFFFNNPWAAFQIHSWQQGAANRKWDWGKLISDLNCACQIVFLFCASSNNKKPSVFFWIWQANVSTCCFLHPLLEPATDNSFASQQLCCLLLKAPVRRLRAALGSQTHSWGSNFKHAQRVVLVWKWPATEKNRSTQEVKVGWAGFMIWLILAGFSGNY